MSDIQIIKAVFDGAIIYKDLDKDRVAEVTGGSFEGIIKKKYASKFNLFYYKGFVVSVIEDLKMEDMPKILNALRKPYAEHKDGYYAIGAMADILDEVGIFSHRSIARPTITRFNLSFKDWTIKNNGLTETISFEKVIKYEKP